MVKVYTIFKNKTSLQETACGFFLKAANDSQELPHPTVLVSRWQRLVVAV